MCVEGVVRIREGALGPGYDWMFGGEREMNCNLLNRGGMETSPYLNQMCG